MPLRLAAVSFLNARPLLEGLDEDPRFEVLRMPPAEAAARLVAGTVDVGLVPCVTLLQDADLTFVEGLCIGASGPVDSVLVHVDAERLERVRAGEGELEVVLDPRSRSSQALTRIWLEQLLGIPATRLRYREGEPEDAGGADAVLIIGDRALTTPCAPGRRVVDLAEAWTGALGLPFVFAVWALKRSVLDRHPWLPARLADALEEGRSRLPELAESIAGEREFSRTRALDYLDRRIRYRMGPRELAGMREFLGRAARG